MVGDEEHEEGVNETETEDGGGGRRWGKYGEQLKMLTLLVGEPSEVFAGLLNMAVYR